MMRSFFKIGEVNLKLQTPNGLNPNPLWQRNKQHGNVWLRAHLTLPAQASIPSYNLVFEAIVGKGKHM
jgi:hypothetical protein